jgi:hypothetical protein
MVLGERQAFNEIGIEGYSDTFGNIPIWETQVT